MLGIFSKSTVFAKQLTLFWTGPGDQGVELDLIPFLKVVCKKVSVRPLSSSGTRSEGCTNANPGQHMADLKQEADRLLHQSLSTNTWSTYKTVWMIGSSYVARARREPSLHLARHNNILWLARGGLQWAELDSVVDAQVQAMQRRPRAVLIHLGSNDLCSTKASQLLVDMEASIQHIQRALAAIEATKTSSRFRNASPSEKGGAIWEEKTKMTLEYCFEEGYIMSPKNVEDVKNRLWNKIFKFTHQSDKRRKHRKKEIQKDKRSYEYEPDSFSFVLEECFTYRDTIYLAVYDTYTPKRIQVFVDGSSKESFMQPFVITEHSHGFCDLIDDPQASSVQTLTSKHRGLPPDDIMWHMGVLKEYKNHRCSVIEMF